MVLFVPCLHNSKYIFPCLHNLYAILCMSIKNQFGITCFNRAWNLSSSRSRAHTMCTSTTAANFFNYLTKCILRVRFWSWQKPFGKCDNSFNILVTFIFHKFDTSLSLFSKMCDIILYFASPFIHITGEINGTAQLKASHEIN